MAPEGNRTYGGRTGYIMRSVVPFVRKLKLPVLLYRIEGGYGAEPRWSSDVRKGSMHSYVFRVIEPEEYEQLSNDELYAVIKEGLFVDEGRADGLYRSGKGRNILSARRTFARSADFQFLKVRKTA